MAAVAQRREVPAPLPSSFYFLFPSDAPLLFFPFSFYFLFPLIISKCSIERTKIGRSQEHVRDNRLIEIVGIPTEDDSSSVCLSMFHHRCLVWRPSRMDHSPRDQ